ncbi:MAG: RICIN domain-containing protein [Myxococcales bacterium]|nr:RICIN domain-containing protein [Myxococcales bacterium]
MNGLPWWVLGLGCSFLQTEPEVEVRPGEVEIVLADQLDGILNGYCLDIAGGNRNVDTSKGLQAHTCYSYKGSLGTDQIFDSTKFAEGTLSMPRYSVGATLSGLSAGDTVALAPCDDRPLQQLVFTGTGTITARQAPQMCLTAADATRAGGGSQHQIKTLTLETCDAGLSARQQWRTRAQRD